MSILTHFPHITLSNDQLGSLQKIESFLSDNTDVFILKGYAGSGKTTILKGLVEYLYLNNRNFSLMAPTGRAAKVIREKTGQEAFTIHKTIYSYVNVQPAYILMTSHDQYNLFVFGCVLCLLGQPSSAMKKV